MATSLKRPGRKIKAPIELPDTIDGLDIAMVAAVSGKPLPETARRLLEEQANLLHAQHRELELRQVGERVRAILWGILAIAALVVLGLIITVVVHAMRSDALIVESFRVPPAMANQGLTGEVVASQTLDQIAEMQSKSESTRAATSYDNNWGSDLKIDIPNTGATADQLWRLLRGWLGKETRISGEIIQGPAQTSLTARVGSAPGKRFVDPKGDLDTLMSKAAELIYKETQPYRYSIYLENFPDRSEEATTVLQELIHSPSAMERKWAYNGLSVTARQNGDFRRAIDFAGKAMAIDPAMVPATHNRGTAELLLGHDQAFVDLARQALSLPVGREYDREIIAANACRVKGVIAAIARDPKAGEATADCFASVNSGMSAIVPYMIATNAIMVHDWRKALAFRAPASLGDGGAVVTAEMQLRGEMERGNSPRLAAAFATFDAANRKALAMPDNLYAQASYATQDRPFEARALLAMGQVDQAEAMIAPSPTDCYECLQVRGLVARAQGDRAAAQRWISEAAKQAPRLAPAFAEWGRLLAEAGHFESARVKLAEAARLAPNWPDPLKYWGDMLMAQGKTNEARVKYAAALKLAPRWQALREVMTRAGS